MTKPGQRANAQNEAAREEAANNEQPENIDQQTASKKKSQRPTDPVLLLTAKLDRILAEMTDEQRHWAFEWLKIKYGRKEVSSHAGTQTPGG